MFNSIADQLASKRAQNANRNVDTPYLSQSVSPRKFEPVSTLLTSIVVTPAMSMTKPKKILPVRYENGFNNVLKTSNQNLAH